MNYYNVEIIKEGKNAMIIIPFDAKEVFHKPKGTIYIKGAINGIAYRSKLISKGNGVQIMWIDKKMQKALGYDMTMKNVEISIEQDNANDDLAEGISMVERCNQNIISGIFSRTSIRKYTQQAVSEEMLNTLLNAGFCAPSAQNKRPWHFIIIKNKEKLMDLAQCNSKAKMLATSACCIAVCGDKCLQGITELLIEDCSAATENILLAAHGLGLGAVWCGVVINSEWYKHIIDMLNLPDKIIPITMIALGYPDEVKTTGNRFEQGKVHKETW